MTLSFLIRFLLASLALYRVAIFTREDGPFGLFIRLREWLGKCAAKDDHPFTFRWTLAGAANCAHCVGLWLAPLFAVPVIWPTKATDIILIVLALAGVQSFLTGRSDE